eukprot:CAMPEP_0172452174 /NCGR_PEP_ID=MMETSP1065-20121228/9917_1 /TAXON_ID=265537 /ORGANISM="Amphiprora paludosa, Strain CCMP125" /LENGTH=166 /DNA_ID=CAMNT_0013204195 /DNA_START=62 /DNA_END=562 /DNA_ORIENTATION=-
MGEWNQQPTSKRPVSEMDESTEDDFSSALKRLKVSHPAQNSIPTLPTKHAQHDQLSLSDPVPNTIMRGNKRHYSSLSRAVTEDEQRSRPVTVEDYPVTSGEYNPMNSMLGQLHLQRKNRAQSQQRPPAGTAFQRNSGRILQANYPPQQPRQHTPYKVKLPSNSKLG